MGAPRGREERSISDFDFKAQVKQARAGTGTKAGHQGRESMAPWREQGRRESAQGFGSAYDIPVALVFW